MPSNLQNYKGITESVPHPSDAITKKTNHRKFLTFALDNFHHYIIKSFRVQSYQNTSYLPTIKTIREYFIFKQFHYIYLWFIKYRELTTRIQN